ncbi:MAG: hypothetical protein FWG40_07955 [Peptococcaceae bacterium]|nr:hypothetical protein [Peptococcaceae bacterium]
MRKILILLALTLILTSIVILFTGCGLETSIIDRTLSESAKQMNEKCPTMVDASTRLDSVEALPGKVIQYNYTMVNYTRDQLSEDTLAEMQEFMEAQTLRNVQTTDGLKNLRDIDATFQYIFNSNDNQELISITLRPENYK